MNDISQPAPRIHASAPRRTSELLREFARGVLTPRVTIAEIVNALGDRGLGVLIAIFALPNIVPTGIPGGNTIFGIPVVIFAFHLVIGVRHLALPKFIGLRSMATPQFVRLTDKFARLLSWFERLLHPRYPIVTAPAAERVIGAICIVFAVVSALPVPFGHTLPGLALTMIGLGLIERDGLAIVGGIIIGAIGVIVAALITFGLVQGLDYLMQYI